MVLRTPPSTSRSTGNPFPDVITRPSLPHLAKTADTRRFRHSQRTVFYVLSDALAVVTAVLIADLLSIYTWAPDFGVITDHFFTARNLLLSAAVSVFWLACIGLTHGYSHQARTFHRIGRENVIKGSLVFASGLAMVDAISSYSVFRHFALFGLPVGLFLLMVSRMVNLRVTDRFRTDLRHSFLAIGQVRDINRMILSFRDREDVGDLIHGILLTDPENRDELLDVHGIPVDGICMSILTTEEFAKAAAGYECDAVWVASIGEFGHRNLRRLSWQLDKLNMRLYLDPMLEGISGTRLDVVPFGPRHALFVDRPRFSAANGLIKRVFDITVSAVALIIVSPVMLLTALAIKLEDRGPVFYVSTRIGLHGQPFRIFKFRSMHTDADARLQKLREQVGAEGLFKMKNDPRVTRVGRFIRKTSIDELPQFFNSLMGSMSVVGPRPHLKHEVDAFGSDMRMRMEVRPGITGLWQVSGRSDLTPEQAERLDLYYVDNWSLALDIKTIARTFRAVALSRGAY